MGVLDGKVAVVTGASSGSGRGIAKRFVEEGASVVMLARGHERLESLASELGERAVPVATDLTDPDSVRAAFAVVEERFGQLDVLINNAAIYRPCALEFLTDDDIARQVGTNFVGPVYTCRAAIPLMRAAGAGDIVNVSSESTLDPFPMLSMYVATKAALEMFDRILAEELRDDNIRVTTLVQGTAAGTGGGVLDFQWQPEHAVAASNLWMERGYIQRVAGHMGGQDVEDVGDVHIFIVTRPRTQKLDTVYCRSF
jgi:meso-butanediol dehydrogenase / (S,S)-butanediol dehydrogenase / diacetyl reductase